MEIENDNPFSEESLENTSLPKKPSNTSKKTFKLLFLVIILLVLIAGLFAIYLINQEEEERIIINEVQDTVNVFEYLDVLSIQESFFTCMGENNVAEDLYLVDYEEFDFLPVEQKYEGLRWINDNDEIELLKRYHRISLDSLQNEDFVYEAAIYLPECLEDLERYLQLENFVLNENNNYLDTGTKVISYERDNLKCLIMGNFENMPSVSLSCGDFLTASTPSEYREIYNSLNPENDLDVFVELWNVYDTFAFGGYGSRFYPGGGVVILENKNGDWEEILWGQDLWPCEELLDANVPPEVLEHSFSSSCFNEEMEEESYMIFYQRNL